MDPLKDKPADIGSMSLAHGLMYVFLGVLLFGACMTMAKLVWSALVWVWGLPI